ncbi:hypothetical protein PG996_013834 [Apiospora saccharicola]|uniref:Heterokaryon incompatibility domain-containing protein n=1 Tax=Apiospora saccharicola TaxID=335842 RepID=A0ABR1TIJ4_9PEZI
MDNIYLYEYTPIESHREIRLIQFHWCGDGISASIQSFPIEETLRFYCALSYTWTSDSNPSVADNHLLRVGDKHIPVLDALRPFFQNLHSKGTDISGTWWWIDSICIDLENVDEREEQVKLMGRIYSNAAQVIIWLDGAGSSNVDRAVPFIEDLSNTVREQKRKLNVEQLRQKYQPEHQQENWDALQNFFQQKWWDRIWTLQEYALAKDGDVQFWCGLHTIPLPAIEDALWVADKCHNVSLKQTLAFHRAYNRRRIRLVHALVHKKQTKRTISLVALAAYSACFNAKDPRDRLYGIMALGTDASLLDVSYDIGVEETYARFVQSFIKHYNSLDIICFASLWSAQPNSSLPSWIPDWRTRVDPFVVPLMVSQSANTHIGNLRGPTYVDEDHNSWLCYAAHLLVRGTILAEVDGLAASADAELIQTSTRSSPEPALPSDVMARSICKTLVLDRKDRYLRFPEPDEFFQDFIWLCEKVLADKGADVPEDFRTWFRRTKNLSIRGRKLEEVLRDSIDAKHGHWSVQTPNQDESHMETFFSRFYDSIVYMSLRLMITNQGGIGLVSQKAKKGDFICVLLGCSVPVLLRQSRDGDNFTLIGECFLDGFMDGANLEHHPPYASFCIE